MVFFSVCYVVDCFCLLLQVTQLEDFFGSTDVFFAYGNERYSREDFDLDVEGKDSYNEYWDSDIHELLNMRKYILNLLR